MSEWKIFNINRWWKAVLMLGILATVGSVTFDIKFIQSKHLFGLGMGLILVGIAYWMAWKTLSAFVDGGILSTKTVKHNIASIFVLLFGIGLIGLFGFLIVKGLI